MTDLFGKTPQPAKTDPRELICDTCKGPYAHMCVGNLKFCRRCLPPDWFPANRETAQ